MPVSTEDTFLRLACLDYGEWRPSHADEARRFLAEHPALTHASLHAAAAAGDVRAAGEILEREPARARARGGPHGWQPLLYACYSRIERAEDAGDGRSTLEVARLLLLRGADPNAGFLCGDEVPPFTALTGVFGRGEDGSNQPPHAREQAFARLLLDAGADPNDGQALYNRHFQPDDAHLELLLAYGLGRDRGGPWYERLGERLESPGRLLVEELWSAARKNYLARARLLVDHGADVNAPGRRDGRTPYEAAMRHGNREIAELLLARGAKRVEPGREDAFAAACIAGDRAEALALLERDPQLTERLGQHGRVELLQRAVEVNRPDGIRLMAELGFPLDGLTRHDGVGVSLAATPMHNAAWLGNVELVKLLVELGADPNMREPSYDATPLGWAEHNRQQAVVDYLRGLSSRAAAPTIAPG